MKYFIVLLALTSAVAAYDQNITVKGTVICEKRRYKDVTVQLWERDRFDPDDLLKEMKTNSEGDFLITGGENEVTAIRPYLKIIHQCKVKSKDCTRTTEYEIPKEYINKSPYDMTYINLDIYSAVDNEKC
ncbi:unnamed protein product [Auanema sp. JU1783]|nr:unnamed protein product [Auanema sp. JU1783]